MQAAASTKTTNASGRPAHPFTHFAKGWSIARCATALAMLIGSMALCAQEAPCGISSVQETAELKYPPISRAAHVEGSVILLTTIAHDGTVVETKPISGPMMLREAAIAYVKGWKANTSDGSRQCPIVITFRLTGPTDKECGSDDDKPLPSYPSKRTDVQHVSIARENICIRTIRDIAPIKGR
jgi:hypothetical protein